MPCANCNTQFTLIKWKIKCMLCSKNFCSECILQSRCKPCHQVHSTNLKQAELLKLKVRDLKLYLVNRNHAINHCKEKRELVKMVQTLNGIHERDLQNHTESYSNSHDIESNHNNADSDEMDWEFTPAPPSYTATQTSFPTAQEFETTTTQQTTTTTNNSNGSTTRFQSSTTTTTKSNPSKNQTIKLNDIQSGDDIKSFSIKQLKGLLKENLVDTTGILEKDELINKVVNLFEDNLKNHNLIDETTTSEVAGFSGDHSSHTTKGDENFCKICWDGPVDCVFLECGHMVTCIGCSKHVTECPICRQNIVRTIRVFKS